MSNATATSATLCVAVLLCACYVHTRAHVISRITERHRTCPDAIQFFNGAGDVGRPYIEVARLSVWWPADMVADLKEVEDAERRKATKLGANGIIRGRLVQRDSSQPPIIPAHLTLRDSLQPRYGGDTSGVAIFIPEDTIRAGAACDGARHAR